MRQNILSVFFLFMLPCCGFSASLKDCIEAGLLNNSELKKARAEFNGFSERQKQSLANLLPSISLTVARSKVDQERSDSNQIVLDQKYNTESDALTLRQPIYRPSLFKDYEKSKLDVDAQRFRFDYREDLLEMKIVESYFRLLKSLAKKSLINKKAGLLEEQRTASEKSIAAGVGTITEMFELQSASDKAKVELISVEQSIKIELNELSLLTGLKLKNVKELDNEVMFRKIDTKTLEEWEHYAISENYEAMAIKNQIQSAEKDLSSKKYARFPTLDLTLQLARGSSESTFFVNSETKTQSIGLNFFMPIYQGGGVSSKIRESAYRLEAEKQSLATKEDELRKTVQKAFYGMAENLKLIEALRTAIKSAEIEFDANKKSAIAGIRRQLDVLISQQKLITAENELVQAKINVLLFWAQLRMLSGRLNNEAIAYMNTFLVR